MSLISSRSFGLGAGVTVTTDGVNIYLPQPISGFQIVNRGENPVYLLVNLRITDGESWPEPTAAIPTVKTIDGVDNDIEALTAAQAVERGIQIAADDPPFDIRAFGAFNSGPGIMHLSLISTGGDSLVTGGSFDLSPAS